MNCPYCGGALEKGTLHSRGGEYFLPDGAKLPAWFTRESRSGRSGWRGTRL